MANFFYRKCYLRYINVPLRSFSLSLSLSLSLSCADAIFFCCIYIIFGWMQREEERRVGCRRRRFGCWIAAIINIIYYLLMVDLLSRLG